MNLDPRRGVLGETSSQRDGDFGIHEALSALDGEASGETGVIQYHGERASAPPAHGSSIKEAITGR